MGGLDSGTEVDQHTGIDRVGFGEDAGGSGEVADLTWVDADSGEMMINEVTEQGVLITTGGLHDDARRGVFGEGLGQRAVTGGPVGKRLDGKIGAEGHVQGRLGDVNADDGSGIKHVRSPFLR